MNRIEAKFKQVKQAGKTALITYICAGDPDLKTTYELVLEFERSGADIIELGVPFSDPIADGPTIQRAGQRSLKNNTSLPDIINLVNRIREKSQIPILLMTYFNPVLQYGIEKLAKASKSAGIDGFIIPDLLPEGGKEIAEILRKNEIDLVYLISPLTNPKRLRLINRDSTGFIYYVSVTGITGARSALPAHLRQQASLLRQQTDKPLAVGFGVSSGRQVKELAKYFDGVIVGSAIVNLIEQNLGRKDLVNTVGDFVRNLRGDRGRQKS